MSALATSLLSHMYEGLAAYFLSIQLHGSIGISKSALGHQQKHAGRLGACSCADMCMH